MIIELIVLEGEFVRLEPLKIGHFDRALRSRFRRKYLALDHEQRQNSGRYARLYRNCFGRISSEVSLPFVTIDKTQNKIVGSTRFGNIDVENRRAEIGWTWINPLWQRTFINTEAKLLMLTHAFETWKCISVELKTDALNEKSRNAILRLGAKQEGIFRNHIICQSGRFRDSVYFSILDYEWQSSKKIHEKFRRF